MHTSYVETSCSTSKGEGLGGCDIFGFIHLISHQSWKKQVTPKKLFSTFSWIIYLAFRKRMKKNRFLMPKIWQFSSRQNSRLQMSLDYLSFYLWHSRDWIKRFLVGKKLGLHSRETNNSVVSQIIRITCI